MTELVNISINNIEIVVITNVNITRNHNLFLSHLYKNQIVVPFAFYINSKASIVKDKMVTFKGTGLLVSMFYIINDRI